MRQIFAILLVPLLCTGCPKQSVGSQKKTKLLRVAVTTSTRDSGLLDVLVPPFEKQAAVRVEIIAVGTGKALKLAERGDVDALIVHARAAELAFMKAGFGSRHEELFVNDFQLVGPKVDPAGINGLSPVEGLRGILAGGHKFLSRGDDSGTHRRELALWKAAGGLKKWPGYIETGRGMAATAVMADEMHGYTLVDRGTYLRMKERVGLRPVSKPAAVLRNPYAAMVVSAKRHPKTAAALAESFLDYLISPAAQKLVAEYQLGGEKLFRPLRLRTTEEPN